MEKKEQKCPICGKKVTKIDLLWPFCSKRCKVIDLGNWASGEYRVPGEKVSESDILSGGEDERGDSS